MRITYTGRKVDLAPAQWKRIEEQAAKLGKVLDGKGEGEAHVIVGFERGRHTAEITVNYHNHPLVGEGSNQDVAEPVAPPEPAASQNGSKRVYRVDNHQRHKPITLDEAILEMEKDRDYLVYRDAKNDRLSVLMRRRDGHFDLIEC